jgi:hypothetical protein
MSTPPIVKNYQIHTETYNCGNSLGNQREHLPPKADFLLLLIPDLVNLKVNDGVENVRKGIEKTSCRQFLTDSATVTPRVHPGKDLFGEKLSKDHCSDA